MSGYAPYQSGETASSAEAALAPVTTSLEAVVTGA